MVSTIFKIFWGIILSLLSLVAAIVVAYMALAYVAINFM